MSFHDKNIIISHPDGQAIAQCIYTDKLYSYEFDIVRRYICTVQLPVY